MPAPGFDLRRLMWRIGGRVAAPRKDHCANCGITLDDDDEERSRTGGALSLELGPGAAFCCEGCADGGPCEC